MSKDEKKTKFTEMKTATMNDMVITVEGTEGRVYRFSMPFYSPLPECYDAAANVANEIAIRYNEAIAKQKEKIEKDKLAGDTSAADTSVADKKDK